jgi:hypothetical protein
VARPGKKVSRCQILRRARGCAMPYFAMKGDERLGRKEA